MMELSEIENRLNGLARFAEKPGVEISSVMLKEYGNPERGMKIIHIAGTNGKGSTALYTSGILQGSGFSVGVLSSPHLVSYTERIRVDGHPIPEADFIRLAEGLLEKDCGVAPTVSDIMLLAALLYFKEKEVDYCILETGLGGTMDSTNAITEVPLVTVITRIGIDHADVLGYTLKEIAAEKAGIIKKGTNVVIAKMADEARKVVIEECRKKEVPFAFADGRSPAEDETYQAENQSNAIRVAALLLKQDLSRSALEMGLYNTKTPGRFYTLNQKPFVLVDGAHNPQGVKALADSLAAKYPEEKFLGVVGMLTGRDPQDVFAPMLPLLSGVYIKEIGDPRAIPSAGLLAYFRRQGIPARLCPPVESLWKVPQERRVVVFGSLYLAGEVMKAYGV